ncbi:MAG: YggT family protein [Rickettsiales bacterium]|nr:YggT family protein [Rickettsiales bacterium]
MTLLFVIISLIDLYSKLLILYIAINILTNTQILNNNSTVLQKIDAVLSLLFKKPLYFIRQKLPQHTLPNIDFSPLVLLLTLWLAKYILYAMA